eukprot:PhM_4_TR2121/c0_g1_i1/m.19239
MQTPQPYPGGTECEPPPKPLLSLLTHGDDSGSGDDDAEATANDASSAPTTEDKQQGVYVPHDTTLADGVQKSIGDDKAYSNSCRTREDDKSSVSSRAGEVSHNELSHYFQSIGAANDISEGGANDDEIPVYAFPYTRSELLQALHNLHRVAEVLYEVPSSSFLARYYEQYLTYVLDNTIGSKAFVQNIHFANSNVRRSVEAAYSAWKHARSTANPLNPDNQATVRATCGECARAARFISMNVSHSRRLHEKLVDSNTFRVGTQISIFALTLVSLIGSVSGLCMFAAIFSALVLVFACIDLWLRHHRQRDRHRQETFLNKLRETLVMGLETSKITTNSIDFTQYVPKADEAKPTAIVHPHTIPEDGMLLLAHGTTASRLHCEELAKTVMVIGCNVQYRQVCYWSSRCEYVTGFKEDVVKGKDIFAFLSDEMSKLKLRQLFDSDGGSSAIVNFLSDDFLRVPVRITTVPAMALNGMPSSEYIFFIGVASENTTGQASLATTMEYVASMAEDARHMYELLREVVANELGTSFTPLSPIMQLMCEVNRLLLCLSGERVSAVTTRWTSCLNTFSLRRMMGMIVEQRRTIARERKLVINVDISYDLPDLIRWDNERLATMVTALIDCFLKELTSGGVLVHAVRNAVGRRDVVRIYITCTSVWLVDDIVSNLVARRCVSVVESTAGPKAPQSLTLSEDMFNMLTNLTAAIEHTGGKLSVRTAIKTGTDFIIQIPLLEGGDTLAKSVDDTEADTASTNDMTTRLEIALFEGSEVFQLGISHYLFSHGHTVIMCRTIGDLLSCLDTHRVNGLIYDVESTAGAANVAHIRQRCEESGIRFVPSTCNPTPEYKNALLKPIIEADFKAILKKIEKQVNEARAQEAQVSKMRQLFTEYKSGDWQRGQCVGSGAFGEVYLAVNVLTNGRMAVKILPLDTEDEEIKTRTEELLNEIDILATMEHPHVIHYFYCERGESSVNIFMEYASGGSLSSLLAKRDLGMPAICRILSEVISAVAYIHDLAIVHRDIKAANILLSDNTAKLSDFGTASRLRDGKVSGTKGTIRFMAPEVMKGESYDCSCDIWSIGCFLIELITRKQPWMHISEDSNLLVFTKLSDLTINDVVDYGLPDASPEVKSFLEACLQVNPQMRSTARTLLTHPLLSSFATEATNANVNRGPALFGVSDGIEVRLSDTNSHHSGRSHLSSRSRKSRAANSIHNAGSLRDHRTSFSQEGAQQQQQPSQPLLPFPFMLQQMMEAADHIQHQFTPEI